MVLFRNGDTVNIDFSGSVDGEEFEGGQAEGYDLEIGSGSFIPGFEEQLEGMKFMKKRCCRNIPRRIPC